jgi:HEAT repeat protein
MKKTNESAADTGQKDAGQKDTGQKTVEPLIDALRSKNAAERGKAREQLIALGHAAVIPLLHSLRDRDEHVRWEAAKALNGIADPAAAAALAEALDDENAGVRWTAGEGLIAIGWEGAKQVLVTLLRKSDSNSLCIGAHHVLSHFAKQKSGDFLKPVLERLQGAEPAVSVPLAALAALGHLRKPSPA